MDFEKPANLKARAEQEEMSGNHSENLYDQNEDAAGEKFDLATGKPFDNTRSEAAGATLTRVEPSESGDALPPLLEEDDAAAKWLREHGG